MSKHPEKAGPLQLSTSNLGLLNEQGLVQIPTYSREIDADRNLIYHLGVGGFHRSHQAVYLNDSMSRGEHWGLVGVGILPFDLKMYEALKSQDYLYTVMSRGERLRFNPLGSFLKY
jgi:mannitol 2-dehydrogenase